MKNLNDYRKEIDEIDEQIVVLLDQRFQKCFEISEYKKEKNITVEDKKREEEIKAKILNCKTSEVIKEKLLAVYQEVFKSSKELQRK